MKKIMTKISGWAYDKPILSLAFIFSLTVFLGAGIPRLQMDSSNEGLFKKNDPILTDYLNFQKQFGRNDIVVIAIEASDPQSSEFMDTLRKLHLEIEDNTPWLDDVTSLVNADWMVADSNGGLKVSDLGKEWPKAGRISDARWQEIRDSSLYRDTLVTADGKMVFFIVRAMAFHSGVQDESTDAVNDDFFSDQTFVAESTEHAPTKELGLTSDQLSEFAGALEEVIVKYQASGLNIYAAGGPLLDKLHHDAMHHDVVMLLAAALVVVLITLYILFRSILSVFIPLITVITSVVSIVGLMGWLGVPISPVSQALPPIILMAGVLDSIHLLGLYYVGRRQDFSVKKSIMTAIEHSGMAVLFTSLTTAAGFSAFLVARMKPIADFGWLAALGTVMALVYTLILLPALIHLLKKPNEDVNTIRFQSLTKGMIKLAEIGMSHPYKTLMAVLIVVLAAVPGVMKVQFSYDVLSWFPPETKIRLDTLEIDKKVSGTVPLEVVLDTDKKNGILTSDFMNRMRSFQEYLENLEDGGVSTGRAVSIVDSVERIHTQLTDQTARPIPSNDNLIHQEMLLYESGGAKEISRLVDRNYSKARITVRLAWADGREMIPLRDNIKQEAVKRFGDLASVKVTGTVDLVATGAIDLIASMTGSYLFAAFSISLMLIVLWRSLKLGILAMIPNFIVIYLSVSLIGYAGMSINMITVLLGGIALGLAVDDTVHLINGFIYKNNDPKYRFDTAVNNTLEKIGPMLLVTTMVLASGFFMFFFSAMSALSSFGILLAVTILVALLFDVLVIPAIMHIFMAKKHRPTETGRISDVLEN